MTHKKSFNRKRRRETEKDILYPSQIKKRIMKSKLLFKYEGIEVREVNLEALYPIFHSLDFKRIYVTRTFNFLESCLKDTFLSHELGHIFFKNEEDKVADKYMLENCLDTDVVKLVDYLESINCMSTTFNQNEQMFVVKRIKSLKKLIGGGL